MSLVADYTDSSNDESEEQSHPDPENYNKPVSASNSYKSSTTAEQHSSSNNKATLFSPLSNSFSSKIKRTNELGCDGEDDSSSDAEEGDTDDDEDDDSPVAKRKYGECNELY
jgi:hypothetical protein